MDRKEVAAVLKQIDIYYPGRVQVDDPKARLDSWATPLAKYDFDIVMKNLLDHVETSYYVPLVADLTKKPKSQSRSVPDVKETLAYIQTMDKREPASEEVKQEEARKVREILGIKREPDHGRA